MEEQAPIRVLVADDDPPTRILLRAAISQWGYEVVEAKDGEEAWNLLQEQNAPRLLILDWLMPKLDGVALCTRIKNEMLRHPFIILLTRVTGATNIVKGLDAGANEFLSKPFNMAELRSRLSVGEKIIRLETLLENHQQLLSYVSQSEKINEDIQTLSIFLDQFIQTNNLDLQKFQPVKITLDKILQNIKKLPSVDKK